MNREEMIARLEDRKKPWDVCVIGGGATGLGIAVDSASRGYSTLLLERSDFGKGTSSRSTKLVHGGVRYLQQGNIAFVREALLERDILRRNAPHLVRRLPFIVPNYAWWEAPYYGVGMKVYEALSGKRSFGPSSWLSKKATLESIPTLQPGGLRGGVQYYDGQFDDARLAVALARTAAEHGGVVLNYCEVTGFLRDAGQRLTGAVVRDVENEAEHEIRARVLVNAAGPFTDSVRRLDEPGSPDSITPSQGVHIVLDSSFLPREAALMVPRVERGRVMFAIPWLGKTVVGTTDTPIDRVDEEPAAFDAEIDFLLETAGRYLNPAPNRGDVRSVFVGIRPLIKPGETRSTASLSRDHTVRISKSGLVTILGGKWTTYRKMAADCLNRAAASVHLDPRACLTADLRLHGWKEPASEDHPIDPYGDDEAALESLRRQDPRLSEKLHPNLPIDGAQIEWAVREEMARTVEDLLARRTRCLILDAAAARDIAPRTAAQMGEILGKGEEWSRKQVDSFTETASKLLLA